MKTFSLKKKKKNCIDYIYTNSLHYRQFYWCNILVAINKPELTEEERQKCILRLKVKLKIHPLHTELARILEDLAKSHLHTVPTELLNIHLKIYFQEAKHHLRLFVISS